MTTRSIADLIIEKELPKDSRATSETIDSHFLRATLINTLRIFRDAAE
jgi:hypothetical protein